jgi:Holliday junction resolvasome RuvABC endonuclease subunit
MSFGKRSRRRLKVKVENNTVRGIGIDVGSTNLAYGVLERDKDRWRVLEGGMATQGMKNLKSAAETVDVKKRGSKEVIGEETREPFRVQLRKIVRWLQDVIDRHNPEFIVIERFQTRGASRFQGNTPEICSIIVGILATHAARKKLDVYLITAGEWKNKFQHSTKMKLDSVPGKKGVKKGEPGFYKKFPCPNHAVDASLLGMYGGSLHLDPNHDQVFKPYAGFSVDWMRKLVLSYDTDAQRTT